MAAPFAQDHQTVAPGPFQYTCLGYTQIVLSSTAVGLASGTLAAIPTDARMALISVSTANVRWREDAPPTTLLGMPRAAGQEFQYSGDLAAIQFIAVSGSPVLDISFYR
jgi:hypothetical protein